MKIALFSDIHGNLQALQAIMADIKQRQLDKVICLGDTIAIGPNSKECLELILIEGYEYILGNHEEYFIKGTTHFPEVGDSEARHQAWVKTQLTDELTELLKLREYFIDIEYEGKTYTFTHYARKGGKFVYIDDNRTANNLEEMFSEFKSDVIIYGHEHHLEQSLTTSNRTYVCIGSSGCRKDDKTYYTILTLEDDKFKLERVNLYFDKDEFIKTLNKLDYPDKELISKVFFGVRKRGL